MAKKVEFDLALVKKYIFWACVPIGIILPAAVIYLASGSISQQIESRKGTLKSQRDVVKRIASEQKHPNEKTISEIKDSTEGLRGKILTAWSILEKDQREENKWEGLSDSANKEISGKKFLDELRGTTRTNYMEFARPKLEALVKMVEPRVPVIERKNNASGLSGLRRSTSVPAGDEKGANPDETNQDTAPAASGDNDDSDKGYGGYGGSSRRGGSNQQRMTGVVEWDKPEPLGLMNWSRQPKSYEVWFAQEDIWVYQAVLSVIKESNRGATGPGSAVIKRIESLLIGQLASPKLAEQSVSKIKALAMGSPDDDKEYDSSSSYGAMRGGGPDYGGGGGPGYGGGGGPGYGGGGGLDYDDVSGSRAGAGGEGEMAKVARGRYVGADGLPIMSVQVALAAPFRRMPVYISVIADQQRIHEILANCANCTMPIDVIGVRVNSTKGTSTSTGFDFKADKDAGSGGRYSGRETRNSDQSSKSMLTYEDIKGTGKGKDDKFGRGAVPVEIFGWINIYSPPDNEKLKVVPPVAEAEEEPVTPAPVPATPPTPASTASTEDTTEDTTGNAPVSTEEPSGTSGTESEPNTPNGEEAQETPVAEE